MSHNKPEEVERLTKVFKEMDKDNSGYIDISELQAAFAKAFQASGRPADEAEIKRACENIMKGIDKNADKRISLEEYINYYTNLSLY